MNDHTIRDLCNYVRDPRSKFGEAAREDIASTIEILHQTLREIEAHAVGKDVSGKPIPPECSPKGNRLQVIIARVYNLLGEPAPKL